MTTDRTVNEAGLEMERETKREMAERDSFVVPNRYALNTHSPMRGLSLNITKFVVSEPAVIQKVNNI